MITYIVATTALLAAIVLLALIASLRLRPRICFLGSAIAVTLFSSESSACVSDLRRAAEIARRQNVDAHTLRRALVTAFYLTKVFQTLALLAGIGIALQIASLLGW